MTRKTPYNIALSATATVFHRKFWCLKGNLVALNNQHRIGGNRLGEKRYKQV